MATETGAMTDLLQRTYGADAAARMRPGKMCSIGGRKTGHLLKLARNPNPAAAEQWKVTVAWPTMEAYDDEAESHACDCPWSMESHVHHSGYYRDLAEAVGVLDAAAADLQARRPHKLPASMTASAEQR